MPARFILRASVALLVAWLVIPSIAQSQGGRNRVRITVGRGLVTFALQRSGVSQGSAPVTMTTRWRLPPGSQLSVYAYFSTPARALTNGSTGPGNVIPSSKVSGSVNGGAAQTFTAPGPFSGGGSLRIFRVNSTNRNQRRTDTLGLSIDTSGLNLRPGAYSGTMLIQAQVL